MSYEKAFVRAINTLIANAKDRHATSVSLDELTRAITEAHEASPTPAAAALCANCPHPHHPHRLCTEVPGSGRTGDLCMCNCSDARLVAGQAEEEKPLRDIDPDELIRRVEHSLLTTLDERERALVKVTRHTMGDMLRTSRVQLKVIPAFTGAKSTGQDESERSWARRNQKPERGGSGWLTAVAAVAESLPVSPEDERIVDEHMAKVTAGREARPIERRATAEERGGADDD